MSLSQNLKTLRYKELKQYELMNFLQEYKNTRRYYFIVVSMLIKIKYFMPFQHFGADRKKIL